MPPDRMPITALHGIALLAIVSGMLVLLGWFTLPVRVAMLVVLAIVFVRRGCTPTVLPLFKRGSDLSRPERRERGWAPSVIPMAAAALAATLMLWSSGTTDPIRSPWSVVPVPFFFLYALLAVFSARGGCALGTGISLALSSLVALLVYPLGFGFDHFIHAAAERIIAAAGALSPPPLFYSGHYGLATLLATIPGIPVALADRLLVPLVTALVVVPYAVHALRSSPRGSLARTGAAALLIVPFLPIAVSTPNALAGAFALAAVFALLANDPVSAALAVSAALVSQPMVGIIAATVVVAAWAERRHRRAIAVGVAILGAAAIPIAFAVAARIVPNLDLVVAWHPLLAAQHLARALADVFAVVRRDFSTADALAVARVVLPIAWVALAVIGARVLRSEPRAPHRGTLVLAPLTAVLASAFVAATTTIPSQLETEQSQFPLRLLALAGLLAAPLAAVAVMRIATALRDARARAAAALAFGAAATLTLLLAYPRDDAQARSGLWGVSASDIAAVHAIAADAGDAPYVVLANQMLGAAAIREFGFRPAHQRCAIPPHPPTPPLPEGGGTTIVFSPSRGEGEFEGVGKPCTEILAFPLPAGGPIAQQFWEYVSQRPPSPFSTIVENGDARYAWSRAPINDAMRLVNAERAYVVIHDYWRNAERLAAGTATFADAELTAIPHLRIFRFTATD